MAALPAHKRATYADVLAAPRDKIAEVLGGTLYLQPRPALPHTRAASSLGGELLPPFSRGRGGPGGWLILFEPELHLGAEPDIIVPDFAGWRRTRVDFSLSAAFVTVAPDWLCEVLSPSTEDVDRAEKLPIYARERVVHVWLLDPLVRTLEVLRLDGDTYRLVATWRGKAKVRAEPFDAIELELEALWGELEPEPGK